MENSITGSADAPPMRLRALLLAALLVPGASAAYDLVAPAPGHYTMDRIAQPQVADALGTPTGDGALDALLVLAGCRDHQLVGNAPLLDAARSHWNASGFATTLGRSWAVHAALCLAQATGNASYRDQAVSLADRLPDAATEPHPTGVAATALLEAANATGRTSHRARAVQLLDQAADRWLGEVGYRADGIYRTDANAILTVATARAWNQTGQARFLDRTNRSGSFLLQNLSAMNFPVTFNGTAPGPEGVRTADQLGAYAGLLAWGHASGNETVIRRASGVAELILFTSRGFDLQQGVYLDRQDGNRSARAAAMALVTHTSAVTYDVSRTETTARLVLEDPGAGAGATARWNRTSWFNISVEEAADPQFLVGPVGAIGAEPNPMIRGRPTDPVPLPRLHHVAEDRRARIFIGQATGAHFVAAINVTPPATPARLEQQLPVRVAGTRVGGTIGVDLEASQTVEADRLAFAVAADGFEPTGLGIDGTAVPSADLSVDRRGDRSVVTVDGPVQVQDGSTIDLSYRDDRPPEVGELLRRAEETTPLADGFTVQRGERLVVAVRVSDNVAVEEVSLLLEQGGDRRTVPMQATGATHQAQVRDLESGPVRLTVEATDAKGHTAQGATVQGEVERQFAPAVSFLTVAATAIILLMVYVITLRRRQD